MKRGGVCLDYKKNLLSRHIKTEYLPQCLLCRISTKTKLTMLWLPIGHPIKITANWLWKAVKPCEIVKIIFFGNTWWLQCSIQILVFIWYKNIWRFQNWFIVKNSWFASVNISTYSSTSNFVDLMFTDEPNLVVNSCVHPTLHKNCHYEIKFCKLNLKVEYSPPYERLVWDYKNADKISFRKALKQNNSEFLFQKKKCSWARFFFK